MRSSPSGTTPARSRWSVAALGRPATARTAAAASSGCDARTWSPSTHEHSRVDREIERVRLGQRRQLRDPERRAERHRQQQRGARPRADRPRACRAAPRRRRAPAGPRRSPARRRPSPCARAPARTAGCRASRRTSRRSTWRGRVRPSRSERMPSGRGEARRSHLDALQRLRVERALEVRPGTRASGEQERRGLVDEAADGEGERVLRGPVEPLDVVDGHEQWPALGQRPQRVEQAERDRVRLRRRAGRLRAKERDLERVPPRRRQARPAPRRRRRRAGRSAPRTRAACRRRSRARRARAARGCGRPRRRRPRESSCRSPARR